MRYRFCGDILRLIKYILTVEYEAVDGEEAYTETLTAVTKAEKAKLLERYPTAVVTELDNTGYEWLDGMVFTQEERHNGEVEKAIAMGEAAYMALRNAPSQDEINAMFMLQIAEIKAGAKNEQNID